MSEHEGVYRGYRYVYAPPPIPVRAHDWQAWHGEYYGPGDPRVATAPDLARLRGEIDKLCDEYWGTCEGCCDWVEVDAEKVREGEALWHEGCWRGRAR